MQGSCQRLDQAGWLKLKIICLSSPKQAATVPNSTVCVSCAVSLRVVWMMQWEATAGPWCGGNFAQVLADNLSDHRWSTSCYAAVCHHIYTDRETKRNIHGHRQTQKDRDRQTSTHRHTRGVQKVLQVDMLNWNTLWNLYTNKMLISPELIRA